MTAFVAFAVGLNRQALWQVVRACVADFKLTTAPIRALRSTSRVAKSVAMSCFDRH